MSTPKAAQSSRFHFRQRPPYHDSFFKNSSESSFFPDSPALGCHRSLQAARHYSLNVRRVVSPKRLKFRRGTTNVLDIILGGIRDD